MAVVGKKMHSVVTREVHLAIAVMSLAAQRP